MTPPENQKGKNELKKNKKSIVRAVNGVISKSGLENELKNIKCPTLTMLGNEDKATIPAKAEFIHEPHSYLV